MFLENEIINNKKKHSHTGNSTFQLVYKEEFLAVGGTQDDIDNYTVQNLILKVKEQFDDICIDKLSNKSRNVIFPSSLTFTDAIALLEGISIILDYGIGNNRIDIAVSKIAARTSLASLSTDLTSCTDRT